MVPFAPTAEQRGFVAAMVGVKMTWDEICLLVVNPRTGRPISKETLQRHFMQELADGKAKLKALVGRRFMEAIEAREAWALQFALRHINGWKDSDLNVAVSGGGDGPMAGRVTVEFVVPGHKPNGYDGNGSE